MVPAQAAEYMVAAGNAEDPDCCALVFLPDDDVATAAWIYLSCPHSTASVQAGFHSARLILILSTRIIILISSAYVRSP